MWNDLFVFNNKTQQANKIVTIFLDNAMYVYYEIKVDSLAGGYFFILLYILQAYLDGSARILHDKSTGLMQGFHAGQWEPPCDDILRRNLPCGGGILILNKPPEHPKRHLTGFENVGSGSG